MFLVPGADIYEPWDFNTESSVAHELVDDKVSNRSSRDVTSEVVTAEKYGKV